MTDWKDSQMRLVLVGLSHRTAPIELREHVAFDPPHAKRVTQDLIARRIVSEILVLSTCNRVELYAVLNAAQIADTYWMDSSFASLPDVRLEVLGNHLFRYQESDVCRHLFQVVAGLDSQFLGEVEIQGQVRQAYLQAVSNGTTGPILNRLLQAALEVGKRVRAETGISRRPVSVAFAGVKLGESIFGNFKNGCALILGAGSVAEQVARHLLDRTISRLLIANRTHEHAIQLSKRLSGEVVDWASLRNIWAVPDMIICTVASSERIVSRSMLQEAMVTRENRPVLLMDLATPRNVDPSVSSLYNVYLYDIDDLEDIVEENRKARAMEVPKVEALIGQHVSKFEAWQWAARLASSWATLRLDEKLKLIERRARDLYPNAPDARQQWIRRVTALVHSERDGDSRNLPEPVAREQEKSRVMRYLLGQTGEGL